MCSFIRGHLPFWWTQPHRKKWRTQGDVCWRAYHILGGTYPIWRVMLWVEFKRALVISWGEEWVSQTTFESGEGGWMCQEPAFFCSESVRKNWASVVEYRETENFRPRPGAIGYPVAETRPGSGGEHCEVEEWSPGLWGSPTGWGHSCWSPQLCHQNISNQATWVSAGCNAHFL